MANFADRAGAAAYKVAATLEFAGCRAQEDMLGYFNGPFGEKLGGLLYIISIITALLILASGGSYRYGLYLLIGPPLFYLMVSQRMTVRTTQWKFGNRVHADDLVLRTGAGVTPEQANISTFFVFWNNLVSSIVQELIKVLAETEDKSDLHFISQSDRYFSLWNRTNADRDIEFYVQMAMVTPCMDYFMLLRFVNDPFVPEIRKTGARQVLATHGSRNTQAFSVSRNLWFIPWYDRVFANASPVVIVGGPVIAVPSATFLLRPTPTRNYSCQEMWTIGVQAIRQDQAQAALNQICSVGLRDGLTQQDCIQRLLVKFDQLIANGRTVENSGQSSDAYRLNLLLNELTGRILFNTFYRRAAPLMRLNLSEHLDYQHSRVFGEARFAQETAQALREMQEGEEYTARGEIIAAAINLPYFQGMLLYFLAWTFPFFAIMLVIPGRESAFITWMGLWAWVKFWDLGFAAVILIDNMLYALLPHGAAMTGPVLNDPGQAMRVLFQTDPMYSSHTYYTLVAGCLLSVPALTGLLVKKGGGELVAAVSQGIKDFPSDFGRAMGGRQRSLIANEQWGLSQRYIHNATANAAWSSVLGDRSGVMLQLMESAAIQIGDQGLRQAFAMIRANPGNQDIASRAFNQFASRMPQLMSAANAIAMQTGRETAFARVRLNMQLAAYRASNSSYVVQRAQAAIRQRFNTHDFRRNFPAQAFVTWVQAQHISTARWQGAVMDSYVNQEFGMFTDALGWLRGIFRN